MLFVPGFPFQKYSLKIGSTLRFTLSLAHAVISAPKSITGKGIIST